MCVYTKRKCYDMIYTSLSSQAVWCGAITAPTHKRTLALKLCKCMFCALLNADVLQWLVLGVERTPDPDTSGNRYAKPDLRYPTRLSTKVLISRITDYSILTTPLLYERSLHVARDMKTAACPIKQLAVTLHSPLNNAENIEGFI